jgi:outer membrane protein assembly factor BamB
VTVYPRSEVRPYGSSERARQAWGQSIGPDHQLTGLAICGNAVVASGGVYAGGKAQGFIRVLDITDGKVLDHRVFPTVVSVNGVSVAEARITVSFEDGSVACLGESQTDSPRRGVRQGR